MSKIAKTIIATGASSGLGFELVKQLLEQTQPYRFILGCRDTGKTQEAFNSLKYDSEKHNLILLPLELSEFKTVREFATQTLDNLGNTKLDYLMLNAGVIKGANEPGLNGSSWCEAYLINHLSQHYLLTLLKDKLVSSRARVIVVSSGGVRGVKDTHDLVPTLKANSGHGHMEVYSASKFVQLLGALYWRRQLRGSCDVIAVSPGLIPLTGLARHIDFKGSLDMPDSKTVPEGAQNILRAFSITDLPPEADRIFLTSWGEWWGTDVYSLALDTKLQDQFSPSKQEIEREANL